MARLKKWGRCHSIARSFTSLLPSIYTAHSQFSQNLINFSKFLDSTRFWQVFGEPMERANRKISLLAPQKRLRRAHVAREGTNLTIYVLRRQKKWVSHEKKNFFHGRVLEYLSHHGRFNRPSWRRKKVFIFQNKTLAAQFFGFNPYIKFYKQLNKINLKFNY